jgi:hypothetical protein
MMTGVVALDWRLLWYHRFHSHEKPRCIGKVLWSARRAGGGDSVLAGTRYDKFWTRTYRARLWFHERVKTIDFVDLLLVSIAGTISAFGKPHPVYYLLAIYVGVMIFKLWYTIRTRETASWLKATTITGLLSFINREFLNDSNCTRFTIFRVAPYRNDHIIPWIRFRRGGKGGRQEAYASKARFQRNEGITGKVWEKPPGQLAIQIIPSIPNGDRNLLRVLYENKYGVRPETFDAISEHMRSVRCIISYVCLDESQQFLNLLSLDIAAEVTVVPLSNPSDAVYLTFKDETGRTTQIDTQSLWRLITTIGTVLRSFNANTKEGTR